MKLNKEELVAGAVIALSFIFAMKWWGLLAIPLSSFFWALGGAQGFSKIFRRAFVPLFICGFSALGAMSWIPLISYPFFFAICTVGYGIPSYDSAGRLEDWGSALGSFVYYKWAGKDQLVAGLVTRGVVGLGIGVSMASLLWVNPIAWFIAVPLVTISYPAVVAIVE